MKKTTFFFKHFSLFLLITLSTFQVSFAQDALWQEQHSFNRYTSSKGQANTTTFHLRTVDFEQKLNSIAYNNTITLSFPLNHDANLVPFAVTETNPMHPTLAAKFNGIKSYKGISLDKHNTVIRFTYSPEHGLYGFSETNAHDNVTIKPIGTSLYEFTATSKKHSDTSFECQTESQVQNQLNKFNTLNRDVNDGNLRRYRLALSVSGDYSQVFLDGTETSDADRKAKVLQAMVTTLNRLNGIFERDFGITMQLIANNDLLIFLDPNTDPYSSGGNLRTEISSTINNTIDDDDYDVGHLFHKENAIYGNAGCIACVCTPVSKGTAYSVHRNPESDAMTLLAAHEFGHQFGAYHTQSSSNCRSGFNSEVEPGSGSTIMSYAGICSPNVQAASDDYFNYTSIRDVAIWTINNSNCAELIPFTNAAPVITEGLDYTIPKSTAFVLEGTVNDPDGNSALTYCWEQNDPENPNSFAAPSSTRALGPMFRSFIPTNDTKRYFPNLNDVVSNNLTPTWEVLPSLSRALNFVFTVRDNHIDVGQVVSDAIRIDIDANAGPFEVTSQTDGSEVWTVGDLVTVSWDVANTNLHPIGTNSIEIILSTDGGLTFPTTLITTENDGEVTFSLPDVASTNEARFMLKAVNNVFFAVNQQNFTIEKSEYALIAEESSLDICQSDDANFNLEYKTFLTFGEDVNLSASNLPPGTTIIFSEDTFSGSQTSGVAFDVTLTNTDSLDSGYYTFNIDGVSSSNIQKSLELGIYVYTADDISLNLITPMDQSDLQELDVEFSWEQDNNAVSYLIEIATDDTFTNIVDTISTPNTVYTSPNLENNQQYYWRVQTINPCITSSFSNTSSFTTKCNTPTNLNVADIKTKSIEITWEDNVNVNSWVVEYGESGFIVGTGTEVIVNSKQFKAETLESATSYDFYVRGHCTSADPDSSISLLNITTHSDYCSGDRFYDSGGEFGNYSNGENTTTVIGPESNTDRVIVTFNSFSVESCCDRLRIYNGPNASGELLGTYTSKPLVPIKSTHDSGALTFVFTSDSSVTRSGWDASVTCEAKPNCSTPTNLSASNAEPTQVDLSWVPNDDELEWTIEYGFIGFEPGTGTELIATATNFTITDLTPGALYDVYLKANCAAGGFSERTDPVFFSTPELCVTPNNLSVLSLTKDTATLIWDDDSPHTEWEIEYNTLDSGTENGLIETTTTNSVTLEGLLPNTYYYAYVKKNCADDGYSNAVLITFLTTELCPPSTNLSVVSFTKDSATLSWDDDTNATEWEVEYYPGYFTPGNGIALTANTTSITIENLTPNTFYYAYVRKNCGDDGYSDWSIYTSFRTEEACSAPTNFRSLDITKNSAWLTWDDDSNVSSWEIEYSTEYFTPGGGGISVNSFTNFINLENLLPDTGYYVYLRKNCGADGYGQWSGYLYFRTVIACTVPNNLIASNITKNSASISWDDDPSAAGWDIEYNPEYFNPGNGIGIVETSTTNAITLENLIPDTGYYVYVRKNCDADGYSQWTRYVYFSTDEACYVPNNFIASNITGNSASLTWDNDPNALGWEVEYSIGYFTPGNGTLETTSTNAITIENLLPDTIYYAYIRKNCNADGYSRWIYMSFRTELVCSVPTNILVSSIDEHSASLTWDEDPTATGWEIEYNKGYFNPGSGTQQSTSTNSIHIDGLDSGSTYYFYLRKNCGDDGYSPWTSFSSFSTICTINPENDQLIGNGSFECGSLDGWELDGPLIFSGCSQNFIVLENSLSVCSTVDNITPTDGTFAAFTSFDGGPDVTYSLTQAIDVPNDINTADSAMLSLDFSVNYNMTVGPTQERVFTVRFTDESNNELFKVEEVRFGLSPNTGNISRTLSHDILTHLSAYTGQTIIFNLDAYVPERFTGPSKAMVDNVSLLIDRSLTARDHKFSNQINIYPSPNNGSFTIDNKSSDNIDMVEILDVSGRLIQKNKLTEGSGKINITMKHANVGIYFVKIHIGNYKSMKRIIVR